MNYFVFKLFGPQEVTDIQIELMKSAEWVDGKVSAQGGAMDIKRNLQLSSKSETFRILEEKIKKSILRKNSILNDYIFPKTVINMLFSRTSQGMFYGKHVDRAFTDDGRRDFSFTLFLNDPSNYEGGQLTLFIPPEKKSFKLEPGNMIVYPTKYVHEVQVVESGERIVCVGWIQSQIKNDQDREMVSCVRQALGQTLNNERENAVMTLNLLSQRLMKHFGD